MAETTFAVTQSAVGSEAPVVLVSRSALAGGQAIEASGDEETRACVSSGRTIPGCAVRVVGPDAHDCPDGTVGEIVIQSVSMFTGYRNAPSATAAVLHDGWYDSGDSAFR